MTTTSVVVSFVETMSTFLCVRVIGSPGLLSASCWRDVHAVAWHVGAELSTLLVPTLCVGTHVWTLCVPSLKGPDSNYRAWCSGRRASRRALPRRAWERANGATDDLGYAAVDARRPREGR